MMKIKLHDDVCERVRACVERLKSLFHIHSPLLPLVVQLLNSVYNPFFFLF